MLSPLVVFVVQLLQFSEELYIVQEKEGGFGSHPRFFLVLAAGR